MNVRLLMVVGVCTGALGCGVLLATGTPAAVQRFPDLLPQFPPSHTWSVDIATAPVDPNSSTFIAAIAARTQRGLHPDFGGNASMWRHGIYGMPYMVVAGGQPKKRVTFEYASQSDGVDHQSGRSVPFYPIPDEAITDVGWIEGGAPGNVDQRQDSDRHLLIVDRDNGHLYELYNVFFDGTEWHAGSGAFFNLRDDQRRPDGWTSADAAGLAILPGLVRYDEAYGPGEIAHAFRVTVHATNGYVYPASHRAGRTPGALPLGARLRLKSTTNLARFSAPMQKIFRAMQRYGLIVADNGSDLFVTGTYDPRWDNRALNPAFAALTANDFEVVQLGYTVR